MSDGSTDRTPLLAKQLGVRCVHYAPNRGKGYAVRRGVLAATTPLVIFTDADLPFGVEGVRTIVRRLSEDPDAEMVIASKIGIKRGLAYRTARHAAGPESHCSPGCDMRTRRPQRLPPAGGEGSRTHRWLRV